MKFAFLTSSLAAGKDGVGDYTRRLAREWMATGHHCLLISLNDSEVTADDEAEFGNVLRLSRSASWTNRTERSLAVLREFKPDWVSLQFVCYGFHPKGLTFDLASRLAPLFALGRRHVMLHELWIGESTNYDLKDRAIGWLQKRGILSLLRGLQPAVIHTNNPVYCELLRRNKLCAHELPLPGNIPVFAPAADGLEILLLRKQGFSLESFDRSAWWVAGVFGTIHPDWSPVCFMDELCSLAREKQKRLLFLHLGRATEEGIGVWRMLADDFTGRATFLTLGPQPDEMLSTVLQALDFGIATSPWALIGKSGSTAAMLDHGVAVAVPRDNWRLRRGPTPEPTAHPLLVRGRDFLAALRRDSIRRQAPHSRLANIAEQLLGELAAISS